MKLRTVVLHLFVVLFGAYLMSCASKFQGQGPANVRGIDFPPWVLQGSGAFGRDKARVFYGVGQVSGIKNAALARSTADNRARAEISRVFETYSAALMKDYMASTTSGDQSAQSEEQHVEQAVKTFSAATLSSVQIVDHWYHPVDGSAYALSKLDVDSFTDNLNKMRELSTQVRDYVRNNAARVHAELEKEKGRQGPPSF